MEPNITCSQCKAVTATTSYFCPNCGKQLRKKPISTSVGKQIYIYAISVLFPPLGLWWGIPLLFQSDSKSKIVGLVAIVLTVVSVFITIKLFFDFYQSLTSDFNSYLNITY